MIVTVTLNPAVDVTYTLDSFRAGASNRVDRVFERPGGKGVNVSRVLTQLHRPTMATGLGTVGFERETIASGVPARFVHALDRVRRTIVIVDNGVATVLLEPGTLCSTAALRDLDAEIEQADPDVVAISGSLPPGVPASALTDLARTSGAIRVVDTSGAALEHVLSMKGAVAKVNQREFQEAVPHATNKQQTVDAMRRLCDGGLAMIAVTRGDDGLLIATAGLALQARLPERIDGNPTGAGDAATAALCAGLESRADLETIAVEMVAVAAAAVACPAAGDIDLQVAETARSKVDVRQLP